MSNLKGPNIVDFKILLYTFKAIPPPYLSDLLHIATPSYSLRSSSSTHLIVSSFQLTTMGSRSFDRSAPRLCNSLPQTSETFTLSLISNLVLQLISSGVYTPHHSTPASYSTLLVCLSIWLVLISCSYFVFNPCFIIFITFKHYPKPSDIAYKLQSTEHY